MGDHDTLVSEGMQFIDADSHERAYISLRAFGDGTIGLASSLASTGDIEMFLELEDAQRLRDHLQKCVSVLEQRSDSTAGTTESQPAD
jgi:hypothetical protein